jgi:hypothetical protein
MYSAEAVADLLQGQNEIQPKYEALMLHYSQRNYRTSRSREFATQGFTRRLMTLKRCIENVFRALPPDFNGIPGKEALEDAEISLQAFLFNVFGCLDNLAWIWIEEKHLTRQDGQPLPNNWVGLGQKYTTVRASFTQAFREYLGTRDDWFSHLENYRNALAHRIPPYIPPYCVDPANQSRYQELNTLILQDALAGDSAAKEQHQAEQDSLKFFRPYMGHSFEENAPIGIVHQQMLIDFLTIEEFAWKMREQLDQLNPSSTIST